MPEPYYEDDLVVLYHGDCMDPELLALWTAADVLITDPPYGTNLGLNGKNAKGGYGRRQNNAGTGTARSDIAPGDGFLIQGDDDTGVRDAALAAWGSRPGLVFGSPRLPDPPLGAGIADRLVWDKKRPGLNGGPWRYRHESIYVTPGFVRTSDAAVSILTAFPDQSDHMHAKPLALMLGLVEAAPPGLIADPFTGSGSTLVAASQLGRRAIGVEIEEHFCELLAKRLGQRAWNLTELEDDPVVALYDAIPYEGYDNPDFPNPTM